MCIAFLSQECSFHDSLAPASVSLHHITAPQLSCVVPVLLSKLCVCSLHHGEDMVRSKCLFSGLIIQCFFNGLLLVGLGTHDEYAAEAEQDYHVRSPLQAGCASRQGCRKSWRMLWLGCGACP